VRKETKGGGAPGTKRTHALLLRHYVNDWLSHSHATNTHSNASRERPPFAKHTHKFSLHHFALSLTSGRK